MNALREARAKGKEVKEVKKKHFEEAIKKVKESVERRK